MSHNVIAKIDLSALLHNVRTIKQLASCSKILAMVKSNAYGHGANQIAYAIQSEVDAICVACLDEALKLRNANPKYEIRIPIVITMGYIDSEELTIFADNQFDTVIHNDNQLQVLENTNLKQKINVWLKIDTGMHRLGFHPSEIQKVYQRLMLCDKIKTLRFMTHFSDSDDLSNQKTARQYEIFNETTTNLNHEKCLANSAGILNWPKTHSDWVRPGIILYGISPILGKNATDLGLVPVMTLMSRLIAIHDLQKGDTVGYGSAFVCPSAMRVGIIAIGYGDGYSRSTKEQAPILINGVICPLIGRVAMDMITVDLRQNPNVKIGDTVIMWGKDLPIEKVATFSNTIPYELTSRLTSRVHYE